MQTKPGLSQKGRLLNSCKLLIYMGHCLASRGGGVRGLFLNDGFGYRLAAVSKMGLYCLVSVVEVAAEDGGEDHLDVF